jgi:hypothetical protein
VAILLMAMVIILLMVIGDYFINGYWRLITIGGYSINGSSRLFY